VVAGDYFDQADSVWRLKMITGHHLSQKMISGNHLSQKMITGNHPTHNSGGFTKHQGIS